MTKSTGAILIIAGSDPSGGAGIQADLKTAATIGVYGAAAITGLTVQNTEKVFSANPVDPELVKSQVEKVLADLPVTHIKLGMLGNAAISAVVGEILSQFDGVVVCDPVMRSSSGTSLLEDSSVNDLRKDIITHTTVITPNFHELGILAGRELTSDEDMRMAVGRLFIKHPSLEAIVVTGGHRDTEATEIKDFLFLENDGEIIETDSIRERISTRNTHGTGCTFASALCSYHMLTGDWGKSFQLAGKYLQQLLLISADLTMGHGTGPLHHHLHTKQQTTLRQISEQ